MLSQSSSRQLLENQIGPILKHEPHPLKTYEKDRSPSRISQESEEQLNNNNDQLKLSIHDNVNKKRMQNFNIARRKSTKPQLIKRKSETFKKFEGASILKTMQQNQLIKKFVNNLFMKAYILSSNNKFLLQQESYIQSKVDKSKQLNKNQNVTSNIFAPGSLSVMVWDICSTFFHCFSLWMCPFVTAFIRDDSLRDAEMFLILHIIIDIIIQFNRPIMIQGEIIFDRLEIVQHYFKGQLLEDIISLSMWFLLYFGFNNIKITNEIIAVILITITILKVKRNYENFIESLFLQGAVNQFFDLITLILMIYFFAHLMACIFFHVGDITQNSDNCWLVHYNILHESVAVKYNHSLYWATMTMVTVGYGDITPQNESELVVVNLLMLLSSCMFGYSMSSIGMILKNIQDVKFKCKRSLILMNSYMRQSNVDPQIQIRIRDFIKYQLEMESRENNDDINTILHDLPNQLKQELFTNIRINILKNIKIITSQFSKQASTELSEQLVSSKYTPGDVIFHQGQLDDHLYYIQAGQVDIKEETSGKILQSFKASNTFGEYTFFTGLQTKTCAQSKGFSEIYRISRESFLKIIKANQRDFEKFHNIKDNLILNSNYYAIMQCCNFCKQFNHSNVDCPLLIYKPDIFVKIAQNDRLNPFQQRITFARNGEKIKSTLLQKEINTIANDFLENYTEVDEHLNELKNHLDRIPNNHQPVTIEIKGNFTDDLQIEQLPSQQLNLNKPSSPTQNQPTNTQNNIIQQSTQQAPPNLAQMRGKSSRYVFNPTLKGNLPKNYHISEKNTEDITKLLQKQEQSFIYYLQFIYQFHQNEIDKMREYQMYMPQNNFSNALRKLEKYQEQKSKPNGLDLSGLSKTYISIKNRDGISQKLKSSKHQTFKF